MPHHYLCRLLLICKLPITLKTNKNHILFGNSQTSLCFSKKQSLFFFMFTKSFKLLVTFTTGSKRQTQKQLKQPASILIYKYPSNSIQNFHNKLFSNITIAFFVSHILEKENDTTILSMVLFLWFCFANESHAC